MALVFLLRDLLAQLDPFGELLEVLFFSRFPWLRVPLFMGVSRLESFGLLRTGVFRRVGSSDDFGFGSSTPAQAVALLPISSSASNRESVIRPLPSHIAAIVRPDTTPCRVLGIDGRFCRQVYRAVSRP